MQLALAGGVFGDVGEPQPVRAGRSEVAAHAGETRRARKISQNALKSAQTVTLDAGRSRLDDQAPQVAAKYAGLTGRRITGHSGRRGLVSTGRKNGKRAEKLRKQGGWSTNSPVFWEYIDEGEMFEDAAPD
ncbi:hypothetical protein ACF1A5_27975 [Streptomyces sp. NPDC014864]|uniref:hypothetical protein n=1 Tax=Streptomyces sp. NPDC014864 TaxID=3364924 RepID=UPI0036FADCCE